MLLDKRLFDLYLSELWHFLGFMTGLGGKARWKIISLATISEGNKFHDRPRVQTLPPYMYWNRKGNQW